MNLYDIPNLPLREELVMILAESKNARIERIVSTGQTTDWYDQEEDEFVVLLEGIAKIEYGNDEVTILQKGDTLLIKAYEKHRVCFTSMEPPCIWLCVFF